MKNAYIICFIFALGIVIFVCGYIYSKENLGIREEISIEDITCEDETIDIKRVNELEDERINNKTKVRLQVDDKNNGTFSEEKINTPAIFLEMDRGTLIEYLKEYLKSPDKEDVARGLYSYELVSFSKGEVVIRKSYRQTKPSEEENIYYGRLENGYVTIYNKDKITIYDYTDISEDAFPENIREELNEFIKFYGERDLYEFLETYSS